MLTDRRDTLCSAVLCSAVVKCSINWGVSDHPKAIHEPINLWKHQFPLINHNIFMKQIGSIVFFYTKSLRKFFLRTFFLCGFLEFFHVWKLCFRIFIKKTFLVTQIFKCPTKEPLFARPKKVVKNLKMIENTFACNLIENNKTFDQKKVLVCSMGRLQTHLKLKLLFS